MGTGGGERLSRLAPRPRPTVATEAWPPNVPVAAGRLHPIGVAVVQDEGAPDNMAEDGADRGRPESWLPLAMRQLRDAGLTVQAAARGAERHELRDIGGLVYFLRVVGWAIPEYSLQACGPALRAAHETSEIWPVPFRQRHFLLIASKP
jgi:hypothetical protein